MRESKVEAYLTREVQRRGGEVRKLGWIGRRGAPDRLVLLPIGGVWFVELKRPGKKPEDHQFREMQRLRDYGAQVTWVNSPESIDTFLSEVEYGEAQ